MTRIMFYILIVLACAILVSVSSTDKAAAQEDAGEKQVEDASSDLSFLEGETFLGFWYAQAQSGKFMVVAASQALAPESKIRHQVFELNSKIGRQLKQIRTQNVKLPNDGDVFVAANSYTLPPWGRKVIGMRDLFRYHLVIWFLASLIC